MKKTSRIFTVLTALVLVLAVAAIPVFAATTIHGTDTITFDKYLVMDENANVPNADFTFAIAPGSPVAAETGKPAVMAGPAGATLKYDTQNAASVDVAFLSTTPTYDAPETGDSVTLAAGEKYAKQVVNVDLTAVTFNQPGVYRYNISETATTNDGVDGDAVTVRYLDIYVTTDEDGNLEIDGNILHNDTSVMLAAGGEYTAKDGGFTNRYTTYDLAFSKEITGNQGFRNKFFTFTVAITGADAGTVYTVSLADASASAGAGKDNVTELTADDTGAVTGTFYLKDNDTITIYGLTAATNYTISENAEDYTPSYELNGATTVDGNSTPAAASMGDSDNSVTFTNYRNGIVPTGIMLEIAPYVLVVLLASAAAVIMISRKRKSTVK